jgi:hypothetical protein
MDTSRMMHSSAPLSGFDTLFELLERNGKSPKATAAHKGRALCPCHDDHSPSLEFAVGKTSPVVAFCQVCGPDVDLPRMLDALDATPEQKDAVLGGRRCRPSTTLPPMSGSWVYMDESNRPLMKVTRHEGPEGKTYRQWRSEAGEWRLGLNGTTTTLYHGPEVKAGIVAMQPIHIPEGEQCADALIALGCCATTNPGGQGKWHDSYTEMLAGATTVYIHADHDTVGERHAATVAASLYRAGIRDLHVVTYPDLPAKGDVYDFLDHRRGLPLEERVAQLMAHASAAPLWGPPQSTEASVFTDGVLVSEGDGFEGCKEFIIDGEQIALADRALQCLSEEADPGVYVRARQVVRVTREQCRKTDGVTRSAGTPVIERLSVDALRDRLARIGDWQRKIGRGFANALPPEWLVRNLMTRSEWPFSVLEGVIEAPTLRPDGTILDKPGYDHATGLLYIPSVEFPAIPEQPTERDAAEALCTLLEPIADFPFREESDRSATISAILSTVARHAIEGCVPMFAFRAPAPGTGKSLLADVVSIIATGRIAARMISEDDDSETRKRILAIALEGIPIVLLDNAMGSLGSKSLTAALTAMTWSDRLLGVNATATAPLRATWMATGNNITFKGELGRRVVPVDMDARVERPEDRPASFFRHGNLREFVENSRPALVAAALTLLRAYHVEGRPAHGQGDRFGSFEEWDDLIRGCCIWAKLADPRGGQSRIREEDDTDRSSLAEALAVVSDVFGETPFTAAEAVHKSGVNKALADALLGITGKEVLDSRSLGFALRRVRGRIVDSMRFESVGAKHKSSLWAVQHVGEGGHGDMGDMFPVYAGKESSVSGLHGAPAGGETCPPISPCPPFGAPNAPQDVDATLSRYGWEEPGDDGAP